jgi:hypothetical protein
MKLQDPEVKPTPNLFKELTSCKYEYQNTKDYSYLLKCMEKHFLAINYGLLIAKISHSLICEYLFDDLDEYEQEIKLLGQFWTGKINYEQFCLQRAILNDSVLEHRIRCSSEVLVIFTKKEDFVAFYALYFEIYDFMNALFKIRSKIHKDNAAEIIRLIIPFDTLEQIGEQTLNPQI